MKGFLLLLCCFALLGSLLCGDGASNEPAYNSTTSPNQTSNPKTSSLPKLTHNTNHSHPSSASTPSSASNPPTPRSTSIPPTRPSASSPHPTPSFYDFLLKDECRLVTLMAGALILTCAILLIFTLMLLRKVCHLSRRLKMLNSAADLISSSEDCTAMKATSDTEAKETTVLMSDMGQTQEDLANGATKEEEGGQVKEEEQTAEQNKTEEGGAANSEEASTGESKSEAPVAVADSSSASQPQEDITNSQSNVAAASSSEEPKDVV